MWRIALDYGLALSGLTAIWIGLDQVLAATVQITTPGLLGAALPMLAAQWAGTRHGRRSSLPPTRLYSWKIALIMLGVALALMALAILAAFYLGNRAVVQAALASTFAGGDPGQLAFLLGVTVLVYLILPHWLFHGAAVKAADDRTSAIQDRF